jgi:hypothetical protein
METAPTAPRPRYAQRSSRVMASCCSDMETCGVRMGKGAGVGMGWGVGFRDERRRARGERRFLLYSSYSLSPQVEVGRFPAKHCWARRAQCSLRGPFPLFKF